MWSNIQHIIRPVLYASECWTPSVIDMLKLELNDRAHSVYQPPSPPQKHHHPLFLAKPSLNSANCSSTLPPYPCYIFAFHNPPP